EIRDDRGEIALAKAHELPQLVTLQEIRGDLQMHTDASDGKATLAEMIEAARKLGYAYIAITDHSPRTSMAGQTPEEIRAQWKAIDTLNKGLRGFRVLKSVEMDILESGKLDLPDDVLAEADYVVATIHYGLKQTERQLTDRLLAAIANRWVDAIGHPTGRILPNRPSYALDFDVVAKAAAHAKCLLEINGSERLDLRDGLEAVPVMPGGAEPLNRLEVLARRVTLVRFPAVAGMTGRQPVHEIVPQHFGDHRRSGNRMAARVAIHNRFVFAAQLGT